MGGVVKALVDPSFHQVVFDSGGSLTIETNGQETLVGTLSWGVGCGQVNKPAVFNRLNVARDFIQPYLTSRAGTPKKASNANTIASNNVLADASAVTDAPTTTAPNSLAGAADAVDPFSGNTNN
ncbi:hypothetical protein AC1031_004160 [Aphanomyces cochlioides]|nr:hypothetical protein AC1031_004160 [Aphanomyces cochlioides]